MLGPANPHLSSPFLSQNEDLKINLHMADFQLFHHETYMNSCSLKIVLLVEQLVTQVVSKLVS